MSAPPMRFRLQRIADGQWLHHDFPLVDVTITYTLSGPTQIVGRLDPEQSALADIGIYPWGTWLFAEQDGQIRAAGIVLPGSLEGESLAVEAVGFSYYAHKWPYRGTWKLGSPVGQKIDPLDAVRYLWEYVQSDPRRNIGVTLDTTTSPIRLGTAKNDFDVDSGPYQLDWWESPNIGEEIDRLARDTPFDYREKFAWKADRSGVIQHLELGYPQIGKRRTDLRFAQDENIDSLVSVGEDPELFASMVYVHGRGEGSQMVWGSAEAHHPYVLPIAVVIEDKTLRTKDECNKRASEALAARSKAMETRLQIDEITMSMYNAHASLGTFDVGDTILVHADVAWRGRLALWHRVTAMTLDLKAETMKLTLRREGLP